MKGKNMFAKALLALAIAGLGAPQARAMQVYAPAAGAELTDGLLVGIAAKHGGGNGGGRHGAGVGRSAARSGGATHAAPTAAHRPATRPGRPQAIVRRPVSPPAVRPPGANAPVTR